MRLASLIAAAGIVAAAPAFSGPDRVSLMLGSHHVNIQIEVEEVNPGVFLEWDLNETPAFLEGLPETERRPSTVAGAFRNSFGDGALALALSMPVYDAAALEFDLVLGGAWYPGNGERVAVAIGDFVPIGALRVVYDNAFLLAFPGDGKNFDALFAFGVTFPLGD